MNTNWLAVLGASFIPLAVGMIWYNAKVFGTVWMQVTGMTEEKARNSNMAVVFGLTWLFSLFVSVQIMFLVIHQSHIYSSLMNVEGFGKEGSEIMNFLADFMEKYGREFRTFKHGAFHGLLASMFFAMPVIGINALFEQRGWKYILIHTGYWAVCLALMGGVICQWA